MSFSRYPLCLLLALITLIASLFCATEARPADRSKAIWKVPVIFVTDRQTDKDNYGPKRVLEKNTVSRVDSGIIEMCVQEGNGELTDWQKTGAFERMQTTEAPKTTKFRCESTLDLKNDFDDALRKSLNRTGQKEAFVFVHGFNNSFEDAAASAAQLGFYTGCPVILYSWPSAAKLRKYSLDECNNEWSQEHFNQFLEHLIVLKKSDELHFNIAAHSMGNRLFVRSIPIIAGTKLFKDIYLVNPDFDAETFVHYLARYLPKKGVSSILKAQLLVSRKDKALSFADAIFGGYTRLGQGVDYTLSALTSPFQFDKVWTMVKGNQTQQKQTVSDTKDSDTKDDATAKTESDSEFNLASSIHRSFRIYDVTALDRGFVGHKVPHEFIASMHFKEQAPAGFEIVKSDNSKGLNRLASFFARGAKQNIDGGPVGDTYIVVKSASSSKK